MDQNKKIKNNLPNIIWSFEQSTPLPKSHGCYRSRIYTSDININPLVAACDQLLIFATILQEVEYPENIEKLLQDLTHEIRAFEHQAKLANYDEEIIIASRYAICSLLDEAILKTSWGKNSWTEKNLLALFYNDKDGGKNFFIILDSALADIATNIHLIELIYVCLNLGFTGKYQDKQDELPELSNKLHQIIKQYNYRNPKHILISDSDRPNKTKTTSAPINSDGKKLFGIAIAIAIITSGLIYFGFNLKLNKLSAPIYTTLERLQTNTNGNSL